MQEVIDQKTREGLRNAIGQNVARLRKAKGLSQSELAEKAGITYVHVSRLENGISAASADVLFALADALGVKADKLRQIPASAS